MAKHWVIKLGDQILGQSTSESFSYNFPQNDSTDDRIYTVTVTDDMGCSATKDVIISKSENNTEEEMKEFFCEYYRFMLLKHNGISYIHSFDNSGRGGYEGVSPYNCSTSSLYQIDKEWNITNNDPYEKDYLSTEEKFAISLEAFTFDVQCDEITHVIKWTRSSGVVENDSNVITKLNNFIQISEDPYKGIIYLTIKGNVFTINASNDGLYFYDLEVEIVPTFYYEGKQYTLGTLIRINNIPFNNLI